MNVFDSKIDAVKERIDEIWKHVDEKLKNSAPHAEGKLPYTAIDGRYDNMLEKKPCWWTNGFFSGIMWLMYRDTGDEFYKAAARGQEQLLDRAFEVYDGLHHDVGFMWKLSSGADYLITGSDKALLRTKRAADILASRYNAKGRFIRAWNRDCYGWAIIDCMMNIQLLYWAAEETGDSRYSFIADSHAHSTMENHIRPDGSVRHIVVYDHENGEGVLEVKPGQGFNAGSSWSRGQAWALYGFILSYIHTGKEEYLDTAKKTAHYFIASVCGDYLPRCDFRAPEEPVIYDSSAGTIAACGLIEIAKHVPEYEKELYLDAALKLLFAMEEKFCDWSTDTDFILAMGTEAYNKENGHHIPLIYGDYFFIEALYKLRGNTLLFW